MKAGFGIIAISAVLFSLDTAASSRTVERGSFDLGITAVEITDKSSSPMFRRVRVRCFVANHGPGKAPSGIRIVVTRIGGAKQKVIRSVKTKYAVPAGRKFFIGGEDVIWHASPASYRCAIDYGPPGARAVVGDENSINDIGQSTHSK